MLVVVVVVVVVVIVVVVAVSDKGDILSFVDCIAQYNEVLQQKFTPPMMKTRL